MTTVPSPTDRAPDRPLGAPGQVPAGLSPSARSRRHRSSDDGDAAGLGRWRAAGFVAPSLVLIGTFLLFPALWTLYLGLTNWRLTGLAAVNPEVVGLDNYIDTLTDPAETCKKIVTEV